MPFLRTTLVALIMFACHVTATAQQNEPASHPKVLDERLTIELFAEHPDLATPTGIDVDHQGRVWVIESNTHFPPEGYDRHPSDRLLVMQDKNNDGRATRDEITMFADDLKFTMSVVVKPVWLDVSRVEGPGSRARKETDTHSSFGPRPSSLDPGPSIFVATRNELLLLTDVDGDLKCDTRERLVHLETKGNYPHNGLAGIAFDALGWMYFGFGENLGEDYKIIGSDGVTLSGGGEGGNMYRCKPDGSQLKQWATGFWNPHASCVDAFGRLFTVDNDADSRPPCRLLHIIPDGDYGYRFRLGRKGLHPFTSWNGEIPGTLPMVAGTGEAPSGILAYESDGLPEDYIGDLIVTSWGDHRIDRFRLKPKGASFESLAEPIVQGDENFRPVGIACAPDGSLYFSDWVLRDYKLHGKGRVWRVSGKGERIPLINIQGLIDEPIERLDDLMRSRTLATRRMAARLMAQSEEGREKLLLHNVTDEEDKRLRIEAFWGIFVEAQRQPSPEFYELMRRVHEDNREKSKQRLAKIDEVVTASAWLMFELRNQDVPHIFKRAAATIPENWKPLDSEVTDGIFSIAASYNQDPSENSPNVPFQSQNYVQYVSDPFQYSIQVNKLARLRRIESFRAKWDYNQDVDGRTKVILVLAARKHNPPVIDMLASFLENPSPLVRRAAVQWVAEEHLVGFRPQVEVLLHDPTITADLFLATLAALEMLDGVPPQEFDSTPPGKYVLPIVRDDARPAAVRALALKLVPPDDPALDGELLASLLTTDDSALKRETIRTLTASPVPQAAQLLRSIVKDDQQPLVDRIDATVGLAASARALDQKSLESLGDLTYGSPAQYGTDLYIEALRSLRGVAANDATLDLMLSRLAPLNVPKTPEELDLAEQLSFALVGSRYGLEAPITQAIAERRPTNTEEWLAEVEHGGDAERGRRVFFHANSAGCFKCHTYDSRGGKIGPDLTNFGRNVTAEKIVSSLLTPSQEVAPQFTTWTMIDKDGRVHTGMIVHENEGKTILGDAEGKLIELETIDVVERTPQKVSVMPEKLIDRLTVQEIRDLAAFLRNAE